MHIIALAGICNAQRPIRKSNAHDWTAGDLAGYSIRVPDYPYLLRRLSTTRMAFLFREIAFSSIVLLNQTME